MKHRWQFEAPTVEQARTWLTTMRDAHSDQEYHDRLLCERTLRPVTTEGERAEAQAFRPVMMASACIGCGRFAFATTDALCFWCRGGV